MSLFSVHTDIRRRVAEEAARLIYNGTYREYKHAKEVAARNLGSSAVPSNYEVAVELDLLSDHLEGTDKQDRLVKLRENALVLMKLLKDHYPKLTGSVWRGTARKTSDIDINVYTSHPENIVHILEEEGYSLRSEETTAINGGRPIRSTHVYIESMGAEVVIRPLEEKDEIGRCETYGDTKKGLTLDELAHVLKNDPTRKFVPRRRY